MEPFWFLKIRFDGAGFLTTASRSTLLLYAIAAVTSGNVTISTVLLLCGSIVLLLAFVAIELFKARYGRAPLLDLRRFRDRTFTFSTLAQVLIFFVRLGILFPPVHGLNTPPTLPDLSDEYSSRGASRYDVPECLLPGLPLRNRDRSHRQMAYRQMAL